MAVTFGTARRRLGGPPAVPNVTAHPSTASVPITVSLYNGPLLCGFNVAIKGLLPSVFIFALSLLLFCCLLIRSLAHKINYCTEIVYIIMASC